MGGYVGDLMLDGSRAKRVTGEEGKGISGAWPPKGLVDHGGICYLILSIARATAEWEHGEGVM